MPVIKSAKKKLRQDKMRTIRNSVVENTLRKLLKKVKKEPTTENVRLAVKATDKAVKKHIIHKNKAARIKSSLAKTTAGKEPVKKVSPTVKKASTKKVTKKATK